MLTSDAPYERAINFVKRNIPNRDDKELIKAVEIIGGRLTDLKLFINKIRRGQSSQGKKKNIIYILNKQNI